MQISSPFNRFYHSRILNDLFRKSNTLRFDELIDTRTNKPFEINKYEDYNEVDDLKQLLKMLNVDYAVDEKKDSKLSTVDVDSKQLLRHIEWVFKLASNNHIELDVVREDWDRLVQQYHI